MSENEPSASNVKAGKSEKKPAALPSKLSFNRIVETARPKIQGTMKISKKQISWSADKHTRSVSIPLDEIEDVQWSPLGRDCRMRIYMLGNTQVSFRGFAPTDFNNLSRYIEAHFDKKIEVLEINTSGHNYGDVDFKNSVLRHSRDGKCTFEIPLSSVTQCITQGKNEIALQFPCDDTVGDDEDILTEMRIYVPPKLDREEDEIRALDELKEEIIDRAGIRVNASESITKLEGLMLTVPRGKYDIEFYKKFFTLHGSSFNYKIAYPNITKLFLMDGRAHQLFIIGLDPPIRQGRTSYPYLIMQINAEEEKHIELNIDEEDVKQSDGTIVKNMTGKVYELTWRLFKFMSKKKVAVPSQFRSSADLPCIQCSYKTNYGYLYIFKKSFFFVHKPPTHIRHDQISSVEFVRLQSSGTGRVFDVEFNMRDDSKYKFTNIPKDDYRAVFNWIKERGLKILNIQESSQAARKSTGRSGARDTNYALPYDVDDEDVDEDEEEDEDYQAQSESSDPDEYEERSQGESDSDNEIKRKRKQKIKEKMEEDEDEDGDYEEAKSSSRKSESSSKKKSPKKKKDKNAPKIAGTAYSFFAKEHRKKISNENPEAKFAEISKMLGQKWKSLSVEEKKPFGELSAEDKLRYKKEKTQYDIDNPEQAQSSSRKRKKGGPKKAKSAFTFFSQAKRKAIQDANPDKGFGAISKLVGEKWKQLSAEDKEEYLELASKDKVRAKEDRKKYDEEHKDDPDDEDVGSKKKKRRKKVAGQPKRAKSAYLFFTQDKRAEVVEQNPEAKPKDIMKILGGKWKGLSSEDKGPYEEKQKEDKKRYKTEMEAFKEKMKQEEEEKEKEEDEKPEMEVEEEEEEEEEEEDKDEADEDESEEDSDDDRPIG